MSDCEDGKIRPDDKGPLDVAMATRGGKLLIYFTTQLTWAGLHAPDARAWAKAIRARAAELPPHDCGDARCYTLTVEGSAVVFTPARPCHAMSFCRDQALRLAADLDEAAALVTL